MRRRTLKPILGVSLALALGGAGLAGTAPAGALAATATTPSTTRTTHTAKPAAAPFEALKLGSTGERVRFVQTKLVANGFNVALDGIFGKKTRTAVRRFQASRQLYVDGIVGPRTWTALGLDEETTADPPVSGGYIHPNANVQRWHDDAIAGGWTEDQWRKLSCIMQRESNGIPTAKNPRSSATGLLQIMWSVHRSWIGGSSSQLLHGPTNLRIGRQLYDRAGGWSPWRSTTSGC